MSTEAPLYLDVTVRLTTRDQLAAPFGGMQAYFRQLLRERGVDLERPWETWRDVESGDMVVHQRHLRCGEVTDAD